jgi:hypothetical protein
MRALHRQEMRHEPLLHGSGQHRHPILRSFATPDHDLVAIEVEACLVRLDSVVVDPPGSSSRQTAVLRGHRTPRASLKWHDGIAIGLQGQSGAAWAGRSIGWYRMDREHVTMELEGTA